MIQPAPRVRIRITRTVRRGMDYMTREGYDFQWSADGEMVNVVEVDRNGALIWSRGFRNLVDIEWVLLDPTQVVGQHGHLA